MRSTFFVVTLAACNPVFGVEETRLVDADVRPDHDGDGIPDEEDPCIAGALDRADDELDRDGLAAELDACPYDADMQDSDGDGVPDRCDPFPAVSGDRYRCFSRFLDTPVVAQLWQPRPGERGLAVASGYLFGFTDEAGAGEMPSVVASQPVNQPGGTTTFVTVFSAFTAPLRARLWLSASAAAPSASDVACEVHATEADTRVSLVGASSVTTSLPGVPSAITGGFIIRALIQPGKPDTNILCQLAYYPADGGALTTLGAIGQFDGEPARPGFAIVHGVGLFNVFVVHERDDQPALF